MDDRELMQEAWEALNLVLAPFPVDDIRCMRVAKKLQERLAQPEQEPVKFNCTVVDDAHPEGVPLSQWGQQQKQKPFCYHDGRNIVGKEFADHSDVFPLYTRPQARKPLTDEEIMDNWLKVMWAVGDRNKLPIPEFARAIEAAHGIKENT